MPAGCGWFDSAGPSATPEPHQTYRYGFFNDPVGHDTLQPGARLTIHWDPRPDGMSTAAQPEQITLRTAIYGPFESVDRLKPVMRGFHLAGSQTPPGNSYLPAAARPIQTDRWSNHPYDSLLQLPDSVAPGYYSLVSATSNQSEAGSSSSQAQRIAESVAR